MESGFRHANALSKPVFGNFNPSLEGGGKQLQTEVACGYLDPHNEVLTITECCPSLR